MTNLTTIARNFSGTGPIVPLKDGGHLHLAVGTIEPEDGEPIPGVAISVTDADGNTRMEYALQRGTFEALTEAMHLALPLIAREWHGIINIQPGPQT